MMHLYTINLENEKIIYFIVVCLSLIAGYLVSLVPVDRQYLWVISAPSALGFYGLFYKIFESYLWNKTEFLLNGRMDLNGEWIGKGVSDFDGQEYDIKITIRQRWKRLSIILETDSSKSKSISASMFDEPRRILFTYINEPHFDPKNSMTMHKGCCELSLSGDQLTGNYFNDRNRKTTGRFIGLSKI